MNKETLHSLQVRLNGLASLFGAAEMGLIELDEIALRTAKDSADMIASDIDALLIEVSVDE